MRDDGVGEARRIVDGLHADQHLGRDALVELDVVLERRLHRAHQRLDLDARLVGLVDLLDLDEEERVGLREAA